VTGWRFTLTCINSLILAITAV